jgi:hypothetical protein
LANLWYPNAFGQQRIRIARVPEIVKEKNSDYAHLIISRPINSNLCRTYEGDATTSKQNAMYHSARKKQKNNHKQIKHIFIPKGISPLVRPVQASL